MKIDIDEADRQFLLLSLGLCTLLRPGFHYAAGEIAEKLHGRDLFEEFRRLNADVVRPPETPMKEHRCTRFKQTGSMQLFAADIKVTRDGATQQNAISADTVQVKCIRCGSTQWVNQERTRKSGKYLALKEAP